MANENLASASGVPFAMAWTIRVLLVGDQVFIAEALRGMLVDEPDIEFHFVRDAQAALATAVELKPTVILQDLVMQPIDGFELVRQFRAQPDTQDTPVILLSGKEDPKLKAQAFNVGANDYLVKLPDRLELIARIRYHSTAYTNRLQRDDAFRFLRESQQKLADANVELQKLAALDGLTGIANRRRFDETLKTEWQRAQRNQRPLTVLLCDIDWFKMYNDAHGHPAGDLCLKKVAAVLTESLKRPTDLAARFGGEEFVLVLPDTDQEGALVVAHQCLQRVEALALPNPGATGSGFVTISIGLATLVPGRESSFDILVDMADRALYGAKIAGRNRIVSAD
ncbi:MAG: diguanylate cyclase [Herminiimonas sp.]|nr:diguanylate cyclase [Herminiimonas sp.]